MRASATPPSRRSCRSTPISSRWSCSTARRSPSRTSRCSCSARLIDHALKARGQRATIVGATSGDTGAAAIEAFRGLDAGRCLHPLSARPRLRRAAPPDDDGRRRQRPRHRARRHVRRRAGRCVKALFGNRALREKLNLCGRQFDQLGAHRRADGLLFHQRRRARRAAPARCPSSCRPAISATSSPAMIAKRMGLPIERLVIATNANDILPRALESGRYAVRRGPRDAIAVDGHSGLVQFRAAAVRGLWPRRARRSAP